jgi:hypothetical protein
MTTKQHPKLIRTKLTYANVMATIAAFFAIAGGGAMAASHLGHNSVGSAQLKAGAVTGAKVKDHSLTGADIVASTLGQVPSAAHADSAARADSAASADRAGTAARADIATTAASASEANHAKTADRAATVAPLEGIHLIGEPGEPSIGSTVKVVDYVGFYRDQDGITHLEGTVAPTTEITSLIFQLPAGYQPIESQTFFGVAAKSGVRIYVGRGGEVEVYGASPNEMVSLAGLTWAADQRTEE